MGSLLHDTAGEQVCAITTMCNVVHLYTTSTCISAARLKGSSGQNVGTCIASLLAFQLHMYVSFIYM